MADTTTARTPFVRAEYEREVAAPAAIGDIERRLPLAERLWNNAGVRRIAILILIARIWQSYASCPNLPGTLFSLDLVGFKKILQGGACEPNPLIFPTFTETVTAWWNGMISGVIPRRL